MSRDLAACLGKMGYINKHDAKRAFQATARRSNNKLTLYKCQSCGLVHIGSDTTRKSS